MRSIIEETEAPTPHARAASPEPHEHGGYDRRRHRVDRAADVLVGRVQDRISTTRRAVQRGARKAEDVVYDAAGEIRRRPFSAVGTAFVAGAVLASTITWAALRPARRA